MTELFDEWVIEPVWAIPKNRFLAYLLSFETRPGFENNLSHARMVQLVFLLLGDITSLYRLKIYSISYEIYRGYYIAARGYEFYLRALKVYFQHKKIKFVSPSGHVMFCLFYRYWWNSYIKHNLLYTDEIPGFFLLLKYHIFIARSEDTIFIFHVWGYWCRHGY